MANYNSAYTGKQVDDVVGAAQSADLKKNNTATVDPTVNDAGSSGYAVGSRWFNSATKNTFICTDATNGAAVWQAVPLGYISGTQVYMDGGTY